MDTSVLHLVIMSRDGVMYDNTIKSLSGKNETGTFDILPMHANFITLINGSVTVTDQASKKFLVPIRNAIMRVSQNTINIYLGVRG